MLFKLKKILIGMILFTLQLFSMLSIPDKIRV